MNYLKDTCVFLHKIIDPIKVFEIAEFCKDREESFCVTDVVVDEIRPGINVKSEKEKSIGIGMINSILLCNKNKLVDIIDTKKNEKYKSNFESIRKRYYTHVTDVRYIKSKIDSGEITKEKVRGAKYKDFGECSCIAVAMEYPNENIIVSDDIGRVFLKPEINLFDIYSKKYGFQVWNYDTWATQTEFNEYENQKTGDNI